MIYCSLNNLDSYQLNLTHSLKTLKSYISKNESKLFQKGKFNIDGDSFFGIGLEYETKDEKDCIWEAHRKFLDVHYVLEGEETIYVSDIKDMNVKEEYNSEHDYQFFEGKKSLQMNAKKGDIIIYTPSDIHKTGVLNKTKTAIKKIVFKIKLN